MLLPLNTEFYGGYSTENDANTTVYDTVSDRVTNHPRRYVYYWRCFDELPSTEILLNNASRIYFICFGEWIIFNSLVIDNKAIAGSSTNHAGHCFPCSVLPFFPAVTVLLIVIDHSLQKNTERSYQTSFLLTINNSNCKQAAFLANHRSFFASFLIRQWLGISKEV